MNKKLATGIQVALGFLLGAVLNLLGIWTGSLLTAVIPYSPRFGEVTFLGLMFIGAVQLVWQVPVILLLRWKGHKNLALGVILVVSITALLNATCWGFFWAGKIRIGG